ncbi:MAG: hypothetical protein JST20_00865 [Bacteroidetes bacterium]|nr:hypothetical protein [Bacteroidota bacterium]
MTKFLPYLLLPLVLLLSNCIIPIIPGYVNACDEYCPCSDGKTPISNIARWDGSQWLPLGSGVNKKVESIVVDSVANELYVFGQFTSAGGIPVNGQAKWSETTQSWSAIGTQLMNNPLNYLPLIVASGGKIYIGNFSDNKLYNSDNSFLDSIGLCVWDGKNWKILLNTNSVTPIIIDIIGTTLYFFARPYKDDTNEKYKIYLFDLVSNQIIDSLPDRPIRSIYTNAIVGEVLVSREGIYSDEGDGIYFFANGVRKKIIQVETKSNWGFSKLSSSSEYVSLWNYNLRPTSPTGQKHMIIYDIKADTTFNKPVIPLDPTHRTQQVYATKISGHTLFVGGAFYLKDGGSADVRNIGAYDLRQKKWYDLAGGVCGPVHAIAEMNGSMYVGGEFSTVGKK